MRQYLPDNNRFAIELDDGTRASFKAANLTWLEDASSDEPSSDEPEGTPSGSLDRHSHGGSDSESEEEEHSLDKDKDLTESQRAARVKMAESAKASLDKAFGFFTTT